MKTFIGIIIRWESSPLYEGHLQLYDIYKIFDVMCVEEGTGFYFLSK
jgi:hypothetical protein